MAGQIPYPIQYWPFLYRINLTTFAWPGWPPYTVVLNVLCIEIFLPLLMSKGRAKLHFTITNNVYSLHKHEQWATII